MSLLAVVLMVKDEAKCIARTIQSCNNHSFINGIIVYDTGSTDDTISIIRNESKVPVDVLCGTFEDFATSRNKCLDFANTKDYDFLLFIDANDEIIVTSSSFELPDLKSTEAVVWMIDIRWKVNTDKFTRYKNIKLARAHVSDLCWKGVVHEHLDTAEHKAQYLSGIEIYQDRMLCDNASRDRWPVDRVLLEKEFARDPSDLRTLFYLAQTYDCIGEKQLAYKHYEMRSNMSGGFEEERFYSLIQCGKLADDIHLSLHWYTRAFIHSDRAEPLVALSRIFLTMDSFKLAHAYAKLACELQYPHNALLFVDTECYDYTRWHQLGIVSWYAGKMYDGRVGCTEAIKVRNKSIDVKNLKFYDDDDDESLK
jgi:glycosyltransferase involved in cell wall biosynthesis